MALINSNSVGGINTELYRIYTPAFSRDSTFRDSFNSGHFDRNYKTQTWSWEYLRNSFFRLKMFSHMLPFLYKVLDHIKIKSKIIYYISFMTTI